MSYHQMSYHQMSFAVLRGQPLGAQLYLDQVIDDLLKNGKTRPGVKCREDVNLAEIIYHSLRKNPKDVRIINGVTGEKFTNQQILQRAVSFARAMKAMGATGKTAIIMLRNHEHMSALYYAVLLAGVVPFMMEPSSTEYEIQHFLSLVCPCAVFCESDHRDVFINLARRCDVTPEVVVADGPSLDKFAEGHAGDDDDFECPNVDVESAAILLPTSGSTGLPKAAVLTHRGLTIQLPGPWVNRSQFPRPTRKAMLLSTGQWMTHTITMTSCAAFGVPVLFTSKNITTECVVELIDKYRPSWCFFGPSLAASLGQIMTSEQLSCFELVCLAGSPFTPESVAPFKAKLSKSATLLNAYGLTELQGLVSLGTHKTPIASSGKIINFFDYKLVDDAGEEVKGHNRKGELYLKSQCVIKGYLKNEPAYKDTVTSDGWLKTGDIFFIDEDEQLFFVNRTKFSIKYLNHHVYPEELEMVIGSVPGVQECVVCGADAGPAAAVVLRPGCDVTRETIHHAVNSTLSDYKRLRGGIAFVQTIPRTHNGKIRRADCLQILKDLASNGECF